MKLCELLRGVKAERRKARPWCIRSFKILCIILVNRNNLCCNLNISLCCRVVIVKPLKPISSECLKIVTSQQLSPLSVF